MRRETISALVLARDEAHNLADCLQALSWCHERVVVVDPRSIDDTEAIARDLADVVVVRAFDDFAAQRNAGRSAASGRWILAVDADERATPELTAEIRQAVGTGAFAGYRVPIRSIVLGRPFHASGTQYDMPLRLFRRDLGRWVGEVHETVELEGAVGALREPLLHRTIPDMTTFLRKLDAYTALEAARLMREGVRFRLLDVTVRPVWTFAKLYLAKGGFRDGLEGFAFCALSGVSVFVRHWKLRELQRNVPASKAARSERRHAEAAA